MMLSKHVECLKTPKIFQGLRPLDLQQCTAPEPAAPGHLDPAALGPLCPWTPLPLDPAVGLRP